MASTTIAPGQVYGKLTVVERRAGRPGEWVCRCLCGEIAYGRNLGLCNGGTTQCAKCRTREAANQFDGQRFGVKVVLGYAGYSPKGHMVWRVRCDCGNEYVTNNLKKPNRTGKCNCNRPMHGMKHTKIYQTWRSMRRRCQDPRTKDYKNYGARGITVDPRWNDFEVFMSDMGPKSDPKLTIERVNNDGPYCKENCKWETRSVQNANRRYLGKKVKNGPLQS